MRLIDQVAEARTPADALRAVRDWLEEHGAPTAALGVHREVTDVGNLPYFVFEGERWKLEQEAFDRGYKQGHMEGYDEAQRDVAIASLNAEEVQP